MTWLMFAATLVAVLHYLLVSRHRGLFSADGLFVWMQWLMVVGTLPQLLPGYPPDTHYSLIVTVPMLVYTIASIIVYTLSRTNRNRVTIPMTVAPVRSSVAVVALLLLSGLIVAGYYTVVGYNVFLVGLRNLSRGSAGNISDLRNNSYAGIKYFAPGYVNQFKNIIFPALVVVLCHSLVVRRVTLRYAFVLMLALLAVLSLIGTGQRGAFVLFVGVLTATAYEINRRTFLRRFPFLIMAGLSILVVSTLILGRGATEVAKATTWSGKLWALVVQVGGRFFQVNQESGRFGYWYTSQFPRQNGREWLFDLSGILPSSRGSDLSNRIYASVYGTDRGTEPPSMWGSVHFNFGWLGLLLIPILLVFVYGWLSNALTSSPPTNLLVALSRSGVQVVLGTWVMSGPSYLLNNGLVAYMGLLWLAAWRSSSSASPTAKAGCAKPPDSPEAGSGHRRDCDSVHQA